VLVGASDQAAARAAIVEALAAHRSPEGSYRIANEWHTLVARA
jgi:hypothetical protein